MDVPKRKRNRADAELQLQNAVERLLLKGGFGTVTPNAVSSEAGLDKMLIYRYFGNLNGLMQSVIDRPGFFPSFEDLCGQDLAALLAMPPAQRTRLILQRFVASLANSPVALELMAWEMVERTDLTLVAESARESLGVRVINELFADQDPETVAAITTLLVSAVTYLLLRRRKIRIFDGLDLQAEATWTRLLDVAADMVAGVLP